MQIVFDENTKTASILGIDWTSFMMLTVAMIDTYSDYPDIEVRRKSEKILASFDFAVDGILGPASPEQEKQL